MNRSDALECLVGHNKHFAKTLQALMTWDEKISIRENAENLGIMYITANKMAKNYELGSCKDVRPKYFESIYRRKHEEAKARYRLLWNPKVTIAENARIIGRDVHTARFVAKRYGLEYLKVTKRGQRIVKPSECRGYKQILGLHKLGLNYQAIGNVVGKSRERVRQIINP